jgi:hypothetical protein
LSGNCSGLTWWARCYRSSKNVWLTVWPSGTNCSSTVPCYQRNKSTLYWVRNVISTLHCGRVNPEISSGCYATLFQDHIRKRNFHPYYRLRSVVRHSPRVTASDQRKCPSSATGP